MGLGIIAMTSCTDDNDWSTDGSHNRLFSPLEGDITVTPGTDTAIVEFGTVKDAEAYIIQVSNDSLFTDSATTAITYGSDNSITSSPVTINELETDTTYYLRMKAVASTKTESKWVYYKTHSTFKTKSDNLFNELDYVKDITENSVTLTWKPGLKVTYLATSGDEPIRHDLTEEEIAAGKATLSGLDAETEYTVYLNNANNKKKGTVKFVTDVDLSTCTVLNNGDDLKEAINNAADGDVIALQPGTYQLLNDAGELTDLKLQKNITIKSAENYNQATIQGGFQLEDGASLKVSRVTLDGGNANIYLFQNKESGNVDNVTFTNCEIKNYSKSIGYINGGINIKNLTLTKCLIHACNPSAEGFSIKNGGFENVEISKNTFWDDTFSDFFRYDNKYKGESTTISIEQNTFDQIGNGSKGYLYVRFPNTTVSFKSNIVTNTKCFFATFAGYAKFNNTEVGADFANNVYYNASNMSTRLADTDTNYTKQKYIDSNATVQDPGYTDATNGDFTVNNATVKSLKAGDPRWY